MKRILLATLLVLVMLVGCSASRVEKPTPGYYSTKDCTYCLAVALMQCEIMAKQIVGEENDPGAGLDWSERLRKETHKCMLDFGYEWRE